MEDLQVWMTDNGDVLRTLTPLLTLVGLLVTVGIFFFQRRQERLVRQQRIYYDLEMASNVLFRYEADHKARMAPFKETVEPPGADEIDEAHIRAYLYQTLNLFELAAHFRGIYAMDPAVYGSWVIWYHDTHLGWYFRKEWPDFRMNYTPELRAVFDAPIQVFDPNEDEDVRQRRFFAHVGELMNCPHVYKWIEDAGRTVPSTAYPAFNPAPRS